MNEITFPINPSDQGQSVEDLQSALEALVVRGGLQAADATAGVSLAVARRMGEQLSRERAQKSYGPATQRLVAIFQESQRLQATGSVDQKTAAALNEHLRRRGLLSERDDQPVRPNIPVRPGRPTRPGGPIRPEEPVRPDEPMRPDRPGNEGETDEPRGELPYVVRGRVIGPDRRGLSDLHVEAVDKNVGREISLGVAQSGERGAYEIAYSVQRLPNGKRKPDVQAKVIDPDTKRVLALSEVRYNADAEENDLDAVVPQEMLPQLSEFTQLVGDLRAHLNAGEDDRELVKHLSVLKENEEQQDITYLANKTGWDARMVAMSSLAGRFSVQDGIAPEFYYALFRAGLPANEEALSTLSPQRVQGIWERALEQGILPSELGERIPESLRRFRERMAISLLEQPPQVGLSSLGELVRGGLGDSSRQRRFAQLYYELRDDLELFWTKARAEFPEEADRLQLDAKLGFLTVNNAPLMHRLHQRSEKLRTPLDLVRRGYYRTDAWEKLLDDENIAIPPEIPGDGPGEKRSNYAAYMAHQLRLSYPTAVVADMVRTDTAPLRVKEPVKEGVTRFLMEQQGAFELGVHPVERFVATRGIRVEQTVLEQVKRLQRVYQISPSDESMGALLRRGVDSAYRVVRYDEQAFVSAFKDDLGGDSAARLTYAKAHQVHHAVLNIATSYWLEKSAPALYALQGSNGTHEGEAILALESAEERGVLAYPTLEGIFGEMDYCACEHCRSWLSPAAYLVDLLQFLDPPTFEAENPLDVLLARRPDLEHLELTCENTNTALPYIDVVNEILEHYVASGSLEAFAGYNTDDAVSSEELLAKPQFVNDIAYDNLKSSVFPPPLPFHRPLEALRQHFEHVETPLYEAMESLRTNDELDRTGDEGDAAYGWRDILMERLRISRQEYAVFTNSGISLQELYGENPSDVTQEELIDELSNAKAFARRLKLSYEELIDVTRTRFINPHSHLIPKLEKLGVDFAAIQDFIDGAVSETELNASLPEDLDLDRFNGDVGQWLRDHEEEIMGLIVLSDPTGTAGVCNFEHLELRYAHPDFAQNKLRSIEFLKLLRFVRLWKRLGWSVEQTDKAITALYLPELPSGPDAEERTEAEELDDGFARLLIRLGHLLTVLDQLGRTPKRELESLLACWSTIDTQGVRSLYRQMFLNPTTEPLDEVFEEDGYGNFLHETGQMLLDHTDALRAAFNLTQSEFDLIVGKLGYGEETPLTLENASAVYRYGYLARTLRLSVQEFLALISLSGLDPFQTLDLVQPDGSSVPFDANRPQTVRFIELAQQIKTSPLSVGQLLYYLLHVDLTGKASPSERDVQAFAQSLRSDLLRIETEHSVKEDPQGEIAREKMALVYGGQATDVFFGLLNNTSLFTTDYDHGQPTLEGEIRDVTDRITYDDFAKTLTFQGVMTRAQRDALKAVSAATASFATAVDALYQAGADTFAEFFERYPELLEPYENFVDSTERLDVRMSALLADFLPDLRAKLQRQHVLQSLTSQANADAPLIAALLEETSLLHAVGEAEESAAEDVLALAASGLSAEIFYADDVVGEPDLSYDVVPGVQYDAVNERLPADPMDVDASVSGVWRGFVQAPDNGFFNFYLEADTGADIELSLDGEPVTLVLEGGVWQNQESVALEAGHLYELELIAKKVKERLVLKWQSKGMAKAPIEAANLYPSVVIERFRTTYLRLLKAVALTEAFELSVPELAHFAAEADPELDGEPWLNALPTVDSVEETRGTALFRRVRELMRYHELKTALSVRDEALIELLQDPEAEGEDGVPLADRVTGWKPEDRAALLDHFELEIEDLSALGNVGRLFDAFATIDAFKIGAATLLENTTNEPTAEMVRTLQAALRARHDSSAWFKVVQPINDELRNLQRDALVEYVLHDMAGDLATAHIDTSDKLFEYFLIDVEMDPCMLTSRIRQALSSVQLFIQRCLMNLEPQVAANSINAKQWEWMKRYRVWEANRKVFLWPENWLEPELRDNKSPFFQELESELLQSDITDDAAATALVHYLEKLDDVAKLEVCGMYVAENEDENAADDVVHVIARTAGAKRTYYYRKLEFGAWTPWEKVGLNIEEAPVTPVVWKGRLFLFWTSILQESPSDQKAPTGSSNKPLGEIEATDLGGDVKVQVKVSLYWSEHYHGKWQAPRTSDINKPSNLGEFEPSGEGAFDRSLLTLRSSESSEALDISVDYPGRTGTYFKLYTTHSLPVRKEDDVIPGWIVVLLSRARTFSKTEPPFTISYLEPLQWAYQTSFNRKVLESGSLYEVVAPRHALRDVFEAPFFYQDRQHLFYVRSVESKVFVGDYLDIGVWNPPPVVITEPDIVVRPEFPKGPEDIWKPDVLGTAGGAPEPIDPFLRMDANIYRAMGTTGAIQFGDRFIGPGGSIDLEV